MKRIVADPLKCVACRGCEIACALAHAETGDLAEAISRQDLAPSIYIESAGELAVPLQCRHCDDAPCVRVCPSGALSRDGEQEPVLVDQDRCIGCAYCVGACPFGVIRVISGRTAVIKCDLCVGRRAEGLQPACVDACPVGALSFEETEESAKRARLRTAQAATASSSGSY